MKKGKGELTIVVCSCDKYDDLWYPYFEIFKHQWKDCKYPIVLNTESKKYEHDGLKIKCLQLYTEEKAKNIAWSDRMIETLKQIESEFVLITCDDHFIVEPVNTEKFAEAFEIIKSKRRISMLSFIPHISSSEKTKWIGNFGKWNRLKHFRVNLDTAIWRKKVLLRHLKKSENIWEFEINGTERALWDFSEYYKYKEGAELIIDAPFTPSRGYGVMKGLWLWNNAELFSRFNINIDFSIRGTYPKEEWFGDKRLKMLQGLEEFKTNIEENKWHSFLYHGKRHIPVKIRIFLSKIKRLFKRKK